MSQTLKNDEKKNLPFSAYISVLGLKKDTKDAKAYIYFRTKSRQTPLI